MPFDPDPKYTFDTFVLGAANRLAAAASRRVAEAPGAAYNPLFIYSASGLGKTHLVMAIGAHIRRVHPQLRVMYDTLERLMEEVLSAIEVGARDAFRQQLREVGVLLLDDVQFLAGRRSAQDELLRAWDWLLARGGQVVLASDRSPADIDELDQRLLSRFSGGLITDLGVPDYETRVAIVNKKAEERGLELGAGVAQALARVPVANVRALQGALNRVAAVQELESRAVAADEVARLLGVVGVAVSVADEFDAYLSEVSGPLHELAATLSPEQQLAEAVARWQERGMRTTRLESALAVGVTAEVVDELLAGFERDARRLGEIEDEIRALDAEVPELARLDLLRHPDRVAEAEALLALVRERLGPLPAPPAGPDFGELTLGPEQLPVRAALAVASEPGERYNPLFVHAPPGTGKTALLVALARSLQSGRPDLPLAFTTGEAFAQELIGAIARNQVDSWRARYRRARALVIDDVDALVDTERAQEELFHLYEALRRDGGQLVFSAACPPGELHGLEERLRSRLESGLVVGLTPPPAAIPEAPAEPEAPAAAEAAVEAEAPTGAADASASEATEKAAAPAEPESPGPAQAAAARPVETQEQDERFLAADTLLWQWPYPRELLMVELE